MTYGARGRGLALVGVIGGLFVLAPLGTAWAQGPRFDGATLRVATWGGSWRDAIHELIGGELEKRGAKVEYVIGNPQDNLAKLIAARGREVPFDVMEIGDGVKRQLLEGKFLEELNFANLHNSGELEPTQRDRHTVSTSMTEEGVVYNAKKFEELGIPRPERAKDLFNPKLAGRVAFPDISIGNAINGIVAFAVEGGGDEANPDPGLELLKKLPVVSFQKSSTALATRFKSGDVWASWWHAGWALRLRKDGLPVGMSFLTVKDKRGMVQLVWVGIPKGGKARPAAEFFVDRYLDPQVQAKFAKKVGVVPVSKAALAELRDDPELKDVVLLDPRQIRNMYYIDWSKVEISEWVNKWSRVMSR